MVTTRGKKPTAQAKIEDFDDGKKQLGSTKSKQTSKSKDPNGAAPRVTSKRKAPSDGGPKDDSKALKKQKSSSGSAQRSDDDPIIINRAPVLHLWAASVAHLVHPELSWETCLSAGSAIATITAIAKGRSIGAIEPSEDSEAKQKNRDERPEDEVIEVMQFKLRVKDGLALVGSEKKGKPGSDGPLKSKFGESYDRVRKAFEKALSTWKGDEDELNKQAFGFYEAFRPSVKPGQGGWGKKGELNLDNVMSTVKKS